MHAQAPKPGPLQRCRGSRCERRQMRLGFGTLALDLSPQRRPICSVAGGSFCGSPAWHGPRAQQWATTESGCRSPNTLGRDPRPISYVRRLRLRGPRPETLNPRP